MTSYQGWGYTGRMRIYTLPNRPKNKNSLDGSPLKCFLSGHPRITSRNK